MTEIIDILEQMQEEKSYDSDQSDFENNPMPEQPQPLLPLQKLLRGEYRTQMDKLVREGYLPLSTEDIMDLRNLVLGYDFLWKNYFHTDFGLAGTLDNIYLFPHSQRLRAVTPETLHIMGGIALTEEDLSQAQIFSRGDLILARDLTEKEAKKSPLWLAFADGNQDRLERYIENTFRFGKDKYGYQTMMGIFTFTDSSLLERSVSLSMLYGGAQAIGYGHINYRMSHLFGILADRKKEINLASIQKVDLKYEEKVVDAHLESSLVGIMRLILKRQKE
ncbi:MAG TPA: hypothetical protein VJB13_04605 [Candidatus Nanoarchaeia archaeon]|nr:hypothetical protein [Candidatus Nanoarchaeia archaeon]